MVSKVCVSTLQYFHCNCSLSECYCPSSSPIVLACQHLYVLKIVIKHRLSTVNSVDENKDSAEIAMVTTIKTNMEDTSGSV